jgi:hypothetical protein
VIWIGVDELRSRITFTQRKFKGFKTTTFDPSKEEGKFRHEGLTFQPLMQVGTIAPIIDGTSEEDN